MRTLLQLTWFNPVGDSPCRISFSILAMHTLPKNQAPHWELDSCLGPGALQWYHSTFNSCAWQLFTYVSASSFLSERHAHIYCRYLVVPTSVKYAHALSYRWWKDDGCTHIYSWPWHTLSHCPEDMALSRCVNFTHAPSFLLLLSIVSLQYFTHQNPNLVISQA